MGSILENQQLEVKNLLSLRGKFTQEEIPAAMQKLKVYADMQGVRPVGGPISVTFGVEQTADGILADTELLMPVDGAVAGNEEIARKERLFLTNAVMLQYAGSPVMFQNACNELNTYIQEKGYVPITAGYTVTKGVDQLSGTMEMEVYVGISPNVL